MLDAVWDDSRLAEVSDDPTRNELSDFEWSIIRPLLPNKPRGVPRVDDHRVLNGIYWRLRTGCPGRRGCPVFC
jgi:transposase